MKQIITFILFLIIPFLSFSQKLSRQEYINRYQLLAIDEMNRSGIPASITMAQACLESGNGNSELSRRSNNHFGIKCKRNWKGKKVHYDDDRKNECFRKYQTVEDSYIDHTNFLMDNQRYAFLFNLKHTDYKSWARGLKKAGYATAHDYDKRLIKIIEEYKLYRLDRKMTFNELDVIANNANTTNTNSLILTPCNSHQISYINNVKAVIAQQGDTYKTISQELGMSEWELYKYNDQNSRYIPIANEVVYIQKKRKKTDKSKVSHRTQAGENMHYISQLYGIKLNPLYKRNHMKKGTQPRPGQLIKLR